MKKIYLLAILTLVVSCTVEDVPKSNEIKYPAEVFASIDYETTSPETKVYADENLKVLWDNDDRITLFNKYTYNKEYRFVGSTGANSGVFTEVSSGEIVVGNALDNVYAVYPYNGLTEISNSGIIALNLPAEQHYKENSFGRGANTMVSATTNTELLFKNLCGYLVLKLYGENVSVASLSVKGNNNEVLAGTADVTAPVGSNPSMAFQSSGASEELTLVCDTPVTLGATAAEATVFWIVVPPTTFTNGFTLTVTDPDGKTFEKSAALNFEIKRNRTFRMGALEVVLETPQPNNVIVYTSSDGGLVTPYNADAFGANIVSNTYDNGQGILTFDGDISDIGNSAFRECTNLVSIILPNSMTNVGNAMFMGCTGLSSIYIPEHVTSIGSQAFYNCKNLSSIIIPEGCLTIGGTAFYGCSSLSSISIPNSIIEIGVSSTFSGCSNLDFSIVLPEGTKSVGNSMFRNCQKLQSVTIPESVTSIKADAFLSCKSLSEIVIPNTVKTIEHEAFKYSGIESISIPEGIETIDYSTFESCSNLTSVILPNSITNIKFDAFADCGALSSIVLPTGLLEIGARAFFSCRSLLSLIIPGSVKTIGDSAFAGCMSMQSLFVYAYTPPTAGTNFLNSNGCSVYVPSGSLISYKTADNWSQYSYRIFSMSND